MLRKNSTDEGAAASSFVSIRKTYQNRMRPFMINVRRSSLGGNIIPFKPSQQSSSRLGIVATNETTAPIENNGAIEDIVDNLSESQDHSVSFDAVALNQVASPTISTSSKQSILTQLFKKKRSGTMKSTSTANSNSVASISEGSGGIEVSIIQTLKEEGTELESENSSLKEKAKKKVKFPKVSLYFRRLRNVVRRKPVGENPFNTDGKFQAMELSDSIGVDGTTIEMDEDQPLMLKNQSSIKMTESDTLAVSPKKSVKKTDVSEVNSDDQKEETVVFIVTESSHKNRLARKCKSYGEPRLIEQCINLQYYTGLSPFRFDKKGKIVSTWLSKAAYLSTNSIAFIFNIGQIRVVYEQKIASKCIDPIYFYILMACQSAFAVLEARLFQLMWFNPNQVRRVIMADRRCILTSSKWNKIVAIGLRVHSTVTSLLSVLAGFGLIHNLADWSMKTLLEVNEGTIYTGLLQDAVRLQDSLSLGSNASIIVTGGNSTFVNDNTFTTTTTFTTLAQNTSSSYETVGWFINNGDLETQILGSVGIFMNFCYRMVIACAQELMSASNFSLWNGMRKLKFDTIMSSHRESKKRQNSNVGEGIIGVTNDSDSDSGWLVDTEDEEYDDEETQEVSIKVEENETMRRVANKTNDVFKLFWPWLALAALQQQRITTAVILFCCGEGRWYTALGLILFICPTYVSFYLGIKLALKADDISVWHSSKRAQSVIKATCKSFAMTVTQMSLQPFGVGTGLFYISSGFIAGFFGAAVSYFFSQSQAAHGQESNANCTLIPS